MKYLCFLWFLMRLLVANGQGNPRPDPGFHLYMLAGQSNMAGRGTVEAESKTTDSRILMLDKTNKWVPATDPVHYDKPDIAGVGPGISFAKAMLRNNPKIKIGLIPCAVGGSPIRVWSPDSVYLSPFRPYDDAVARTKTAMQYGTLKGIIWHQGESDNNPAGILVYMNQFKKVIERFRNDLHAPALPFVAGEIGYFNNDFAINRIIDSLPVMVPKTAVVSARGLTDKGDKIHFDTPSARELGNRYAREMLKLEH